MKLRNTILALAVAALGVGALMSTTSSADARGFGGGFSRGGGIHMGGGMSRGHVGHVGRIGNFARFAIHKPIFRTHWRHHRHWHVRWHRPWIYGVGTAAIAAPAYAAYAPSAPSAKPCTCLTKEYTQNNVVVFKDLCTKEMAAAPLGGQQAGSTEPMSDK